MTLLPADATRTVIITHRGYRSYLPACLRRACASNPDGRVVLLGDEASASIGIGEHHDIDQPELQEDLDEFRRIYKCRSRSQGYLFERGCLERWFVIRNFMRREKLRGCLAIDSDVLLFCNVPEESLRFRSYAMTFGRWDAVRVVPHCNFIRGIEGIESFCEYVLELYRNPDALERIAAINRKKYDSSWISDMSLLASWGALGTFPVGFLEDTVAQGVGFDACLDAPDVYEPCSFFPGVLKPWKKITFRDGLPYAKVRGSGLEVPFRCLHYHGRMKQLIDRHDKTMSDDIHAAKILLSKKLFTFPSKIQLFCKNYIASPLARASVVERLALAGWFPK